MDSLAGIIEIKHIQVQFGLSFSYDWKSLAAALDENPVSEFEQEWEAER